MNKIKRPKQLHIMVYVMLLIILVPIGAVGYSLLQSKEAQGTPVVGSRYVNKLTYIIDTSEFDNLQYNIEALDKVEAAEINLKAATMRVNVDLDDSVDADTAESVLKKVYSEVLKIYPKETYFTNTSTSKQYDLEVTVYNYVLDDDSDEKTVDGQVLITAVKTGAAEKPVIDRLSEAKDKELVKQIVR